MAAPLGACLEAAVADAASGGRDAQAALLAGLEACAAAAAACVRVAMHEAALHGEAGAAAVAGVAAECALAPPAIQAGPSSALSFLACRTWAVVGYYNALQLLVMPWVFLWTFSGTVLGLARFARFQYHLVRISIDVLLLMLLFLLILVEDTVALCVRVAHAQVSETFREQCRLERRLQSAVSFAEHGAARGALAEFRAREAAAGCCRERRPRHAGDAGSATGSEVESSVLRDKLAGETQEAHLSRMQAVLEKAAVDGSLATLEPLLGRGADGIDWDRVPDRKGYQARLSACLSLACAARLHHGASRAELLGWLRERQRALGRTALCLSGGGSLAMYHMGVCRFLLEERILPEVISGVSGGSIVAAFLAIHTDEELLEGVFVPGIVARHAPHRWFPPWWQELLNFLRLGVLVPTEDFERTAQAYFGTWTFQEAFARTGRPVSIVLSSNFSKQLPACVMLNHMTAPSVTLASAVAASCAAMGVMRPRGLVVKDPSTGDLVPFDVLGRSFADGSFTAEVPKDYLRSCFGVTQFFVSQVNPHVSAFLGHRGGVLQSFRSSCGRDLQRCARLLSEYHLLPSFFGRAMCNATKHLSQDFAESQAGVTLFPPDMGLGSVKAAVTNPSIRDMERYILGGQRMAWEKAQEISARMHTELALAEEVRRIKDCQERSPVSREQPPPLLPEGGRSPAVSGRRHRRK